MTEKERMIQKYMENLDLSREEAEELYADEQADNLPELSAEQKAVVREMTQADRKKETTPRNRERKIDENKRALINAVEEMLSYSDIQAENVIITNPERQIDFVYNGERYRIVLSKPRKS